MISPSKFVTANYEVTITHLCDEEGCVSRDNYAYRGVARANGNEITMMGKTLNTMCPDGVTPGHFYGYEFTSGDVRYRIRECGESDWLEVIRGKEEVLVDEEGKWSE